jgi:hypothetical protein
MEINASDHRSAEGLHNWLTDAAQTHSVTGDRRPNCIILDEVDGATGEILFGSDLTDWYPTCIFLGLWTGVVCWEVRALSVGLEQTQALPALPQ